MGGFEFFVGFFLELFNGDVFNRSFDSLVAVDDSLWVGHSPEDGVVAARHGDGIGNSTAINILREDVKELFLRVTV